MILLSSMKQKLLIWTDEDKRIHDLLHPPEWLYVMEKDGKLEFIVEWYEDFSDWYQKKNKLTQTVEPQRAKEFIMKNLEECFPGTLSFLLQSDFFTGYDKEIVESYLYD